MMGKDPTEYSVVRKAGLEHILTRMKASNGGTVEGESHLFIFGDFNFRLDLTTFIKVDSLSDLLIKYFKQCNNKIVKKNNIKM